MPRRKKKPQSPAKKPGRGIRRQTGTVDWDRRLPRPPSPKPGRFVVPTLHGPSATLQRHPHYSSPVVLESLGSASTSSSTPSSASSSTRLEAIAGSPLVASASRAFSKLSDHITTPFYAVKSSHTYSEVATNNSTPSNDDNDTNRGQEEINFSASSGWLVPGESTHLFLTVQR